MFLLELRGSQRGSEVFRGVQRCSEGFRGVQRCSEVFRGTFKKLKAPSPNSHVFN
jgi:hypothetical protein